MQHRLSETVFPTHITKQALMFSCKFLLSVDLLTYSDQLTHLKTNFKPFVRFLKSLKLEEGASLI